MGFTRGPALLWLVDLGPIATLAVSLLLAGLSWLAAIRVSNTRSGLK